MSVSNRQRRAAKKRKQGKDRRAQLGDQPYGAPGWGGQNGAGCGCRDCGGAGPYQRAVDERELAAALVIEVMGEIENDLGAVPRCVALLLRTDGPVSPAVAVETVGAVLQNAVAAICRAGWAPSDLAEVTRRRLDGRHLPALAALLAAEAARHRQDRVASAWWDDLSGLGRAEPADLRNPVGLSLALGLAAVLAGLPSIPVVVPPPGTLPETSARATGADGKVLAKVRSLLAKAESTAFAEEAEALSAKAQELISRYALDRLMEQAEEHGATGKVVARRMWIDAPYVMAKATLIHEVADANRCRSVVSEQLGCSTVVGEPSDLDAVELVATSLLVQANSAMLGWGRQSDQRGRSRTASFRRSFLTSYATRIGERLRTASQHAAEQTGRSGELVPILRHQSEQVQAATEQMFPELIHRETRVSNGHGWVAGRAAADAASLDVRAEVTGMPA